jgi:hypothetical protein
MIHTIFGFHLPGDLVELAAVAPDHCLAKRLDRIRSLIEPIGESLGRKP